MKTHLNIGEGLRILRGAKKLSAGEIARRIGKTSGYLSLIENGKRSPSLEALEQFAVALEVKLGEDHKLLRRLPDGMLVIVYTGNLVEVTPEVDSAIMGLTPQQRAAVCDAMTEE